MKKFNLLLIAFLLFLVACHNDESIVNTERGSLVGDPVPLSTFPKIFIQAALTTLAGDSAQYIKCDYDVDLIKIIYNTIDPKGNPTVASGLLVVPKNVTKALPLVSYQHGTILNKTDVPSRMKGSFEVGLIFGTEGYVVACPDYLGMGDGKKLHPYMHAESEATSIIDMLIAAKFVCTKKGIILNNQLFLLGYSQGGHATMAALKMIEEQYSDVFSVTACAPMAGAYDLSGTQLNYMLRDSAYPDPGYLPYLLFAYNNVYNIYQNLSSIFISPYYDKFKGYFNDNPMSELSTVDNLWPASQIPTAVLKPEFVDSLKENKNDPLRLALKDNDLYDWAPKTPLHLCHCDGDQHVPFQNSVVAYNSFINNGSSNVMLIIPLKGGTHISCAIPSFLNALSWFDSLKK